MRSPTLEVFEEEQPADGEQNFGETDADADEPVLVSAHDATDEALLMLMKELGCQGFGMKMGLEPPEIKKFFILNIDNRPPERYLAVFIP